MHNPFEKKDQIIHQLVQQGGVVFDMAECNAFKPATMFIYEWRDYWLELTEVEYLLVGSERIYPKHENWFLLRFENQLGISRIQPISSKKFRIEPCCVEVISPKFASLKEHGFFYRSLLDDLFQRIARLPFTYSSSTGRNVLEALRPPTPLFTYHFLKHYASDLQTAINFILAFPHRVLIDEETFVDLGSASNVEPDAVLEMMQRSSQWVKADDHSLAIRLGGFVPAHISQHIPVETFDTPENRFIYSFIRQLQLAADDLARQPWWRAIPVDDRRKIIEVQHLFQQTINHPLFEEVGEQHLLPLNSQVLLRKDGYRHSLELWLKFQQARRPLFEPLTKAIEIRNIAELYEFWVFFTLVEKIGKILSIPPVLELVTSDEMGLNWSSKARFGQKGTLIFNRTFRIYDHHFNSYSTTLRPDFTWVADKKPIAIFDAKFSFSSREIEISTEDEETELIVEKKPSLYNLYKMHTYRDALSLNSAVIIYPGNTSVFFDIAKGKSSQFDFEKCLSGEISGIGAVPFQPGFIF